MLRANRTVFPHIEICVVKQKNGVSRNARVHERKDGLVRVQYLDVVERKDGAVYIQYPYPGSGGNGEWLPQDNILHTGDGEPYVDVTVSEEEYDLRAHKEATSRRNFEYVNIGGWNIKTWYHSPYPPEDDLLDLESETHKFTRNPRSNRLVADLFTGRLPWTIGASPQKPGDELPSLWVCHKCLMYTDMKDCVNQQLHKKLCPYKGPPGKTVYQRGSQTIWMVDAAVNKIYSQRLALLGKLFLETKTLYFELHNFVFYVLTEAISSTDEQVVGYFAKEKVTFENHNLATIVTLPPFQRQGYGMLMIEFSYELSRRAGLLQTPERPLSDLGLRGYVAYWVATVLRFLRRVLSLLPPPSLPVHPEDSRRERTPLSRVRDKDVVHSWGTSPDWNFTVAEHENGVGESSGVSKRGKKFKGMVGSGEGYTVFDNLVITDPIFTSFRHLISKQDASGGVVTHIYARCTLRDIARATNLEPQDCAFAMKEIGLSAAAIAEGTVPFIDAVDDDLMDIDSPKPPPPTDESSVVIEGVEETSDRGEGTGVKRTITISKMVVDRLVQEKRVKRPCIDLRYVLLDNLPVLPSTRDESVDVPPMTPPDEFGTEYEVGKEEGEILLEDGEEEELGYP